MELTNVNNLKSLLGKYHIRLTKKLGQHFLVDKEVLEKILNAADLQTDDMVVEIGPGVGTLTFELAKKARHVIAIEKDKKLIKPLSSVLRSFNNVEIVNQDFLTYKLFPTTYKLVADIPYQITGEILRKIFSVHDKPDLVILLVQREVGERIAAPPGQMSMLSLSVQLYAEPEIIFNVSANAFFPIPEVESAIIKLRVLEKPQLDIEEKKFFRLARIGFSARRKTLLNNLSAGLKIPKLETLGLLKKAGVGENARAQELSMQDWGKLYQTALLRLS